MISLKKLHEAHFNYPHFIPRRGGKTIYCLDRLLKTAQLGELKNIAYVSNTIKSSMVSQQMFFEYLEDNKINDYLVLKNSVIIYGCKITFESSETIKKNRDFQNIVFDLH